jgi:hypothetical protein
MMIIINYLCGTTSFNQNCHHHHQVQPHVIHKLLHISYKYSNSFSLHLSKWS